MYASYAKHFSSPTGLSQPDAHALSQHVVVESPAAPAPSWIKRICAHRDHFHGLVLVNADVFTDELAYKILFVKQSPQLVRFLPLTPSPSVRRRHESVAEMEDDHARQYRWEFTYTLCYFFGHEDTSFAEAGGDILVLRDRTFMGDLRCCTDFEAEPWNDFVAKLPFVPASRPRQCAEQSLIGEGGDAQWINEIIEENRLRRERTRKCHITTTP